MKSLYRSRPIRWLLAILLFPIIGTALLVAGAIQYLGPEIPDVASLRDVRLQVPLRVYSRDGQLIAQIGEQRRIPLDFGNYPPRVIQAFLAAEDDRFFEHSGVDYPGLLRAIAVNLSSGAKREGGGTITMQLARNMFLSPERSYRRKMVEIISAWRIEHAFSKEEILSLYLNKIFLGQRAYGVGAAAEVYFGKSVDELTLAETALLAGLPRAPSRENPVTNPQLAKQRRAYVLRRMHELNYITAEERDAAGEAPVESRIHGSVIELDAPYVAEMVRLELEQRFGPAIYTDNYTVYTTVDSRLQRAAERAARLALLEYDSRHGYRGVAGRIDLQKYTDEKSWSKALAGFRTVGGLQPAVITALTAQSATAFTRRQGRIDIPLANMHWARPALADGSVGKAPATPSELLHPGDVIYTAQQTNGSWRLLQVPNAQSAFVALDPHDGAINALVGGFDYGASNFNRVVQAKRQPGSSFKPFLYSAALDHGLTPASMLNDAPMVVDSGTDEESWKPQNSTRSFMGMLRMREALVRSRNLVSIRIISLLGTEFTTQYIGKFGFTSEQLPQNLSLALGATQVSPLEMARGYAVFANGGRLVDPYILERVYGADATLVYQAAPRIACEDCEQTDTITAETATATVRTTQSAAANDDVGVDATQAAGSDMATSPVATTAPSTLNLAPQVISPANAFVMTDMMKDVIRRGTATRALALKRRDIAGKTGTTNDRRDAWFLGFAPNLVGAAWVGFDQERSLGDSEEGGRTALPIWVYFMTEAMRGVPEQSSTQPPGVVSMRIDPDSGRAVAGGSRGLFEYFLDAHLPERDEGGVPSEPTGTPSGGGNDGLF